MIASITAALHAPPSDGECGPVGHLSQPSAQASNYGNSEHGHKAL